MSSFPLPHYREYLLLMGIPADFLIKMVLESVHQFYAPHFCVPDRRLRPRDGREGTLSDRTR